MGHSKREICFIEKELLILEELEGCTKSSTISFDQLSRIKPCILQDAKFSDLLDELASVIKDSIVSIKVVLKLLNEYQSKKDPVTGLVKESFKESHAVLTHGIESLQANSDRLEGVVAKAYCQFNQRPFFQSYLPVLFSLLYQRQGKAKSSLVHSRGRKNETIIPNIDVLFGKDCESEEGSFAPITTINKSPLLRVGGPSMMMKHLRKSGNRVSGVKLSSAFNDASKAILPNSSRVTLVPKGCSQMILPSPSTATFRLTKCKRAEPESCDNLRLPKIRSSSRLMTSLRKPLSTEEKSNPSVIIDLISTHRNKRLHSQLPGGRSILVSGLMSH